MLVFLIFMFVLCTAVFLTMITPSSVQWKFIEISNFEGPGKAKYIIIAKGNNNKIGRFVSETGIFWYELPNYNKASDSLDRKLEGWYRRAKLKGDIE